MRMEARQFEPAMEDNEKTKDKASSTCDRMILERRW